MGADVIKIEAPVGDVVRQIGPARHAGMGPIFLNTNRNKRSVVLDLTPRGRSGPKRLLVDADVLDVQRASPGDGALWAGLRQRACD